MPTEGEFARFGVALGAFPNPSGGASDDAIVAGTLDFVEARGGWVGSWRMRWHGSDYAWGVSGVNFDEAFRTIVRGAMRVASGHGAPD